MNSIAHAEHIIEGPQDYGLSLFNKKLFAGMQQLRRRLEEAYIYEIYVDTANYYISR